MITGLCEVTLQARDIGRLERFYRDVIGLDAIDRDHDRVWLAVGDRARLGVWAPGEKEFGDEGGVHVHFALAVEQGTLDAMAKRLDAEPVEHPGGDRSLYFTDPEGNVGELWDFFERGRGVEELAVDDD